jgi:L-methionine (R)-S-oxide reductase
MFQLQTFGDLDKPEFYRELARQLESLLEGERDPIANAANTAALLFHAMPDMNWAGFYFLRENDELVVGPFQGKPACVRIPVGRGVCGTAVARRETILVADVNAFPDHIACDSQSRSELVVPLIAGQRIFGVLDLDSPLPSRFDADDRQGVETLAQIYVASCEGL